MKREIKFEICTRRKDGTDLFTEVVTLDQLIDRNGCYYAPSVQEIVYKRQFTGLKDKNGVDIYEGDIVRVLYTDWGSKLDSDPRTLEQYLIDIANVKTVVFNGVSFQLMEVNEKYNEEYYSSIYPGRHGYVEVIGNIHETK